MSLLWMSIVPGKERVQVLLTEPLCGPVLKARLPSPPAHPRALGMLLEALATWYQRPLRAVLDADAQGVRRHPEKWAEWLGDLPDLHISVEWVGRAERFRRPDRFLEGLGDFGDARRLLTVAATGQR
jgi:hypothetical protein